MEATGDERRGLKRKVALSRCESVLIAVNSASSFYRVMNPVSFMHVNNKQLGTCGLSVKRGVKTVLDVRFNVYKCFWMRHGSVVARVTGVTSPLTNQWRACATS